jgi:hypothetical protein
MRKFLEISGCFLLSLALTGCLTNRFAWGENYEAHANLKNGHALYNNIQLGSPQHPIDFLPDFTLKLSGGRVVYSRDFSPANLRTPGDTLTEKNGMMILVL